SGAPGIDDYDVRVWGQVLKLTKQPLMRSRGWLVDMPQCAVTSDHLNSRGSALQHLVDGASARQHVQNRSAGLNPAKVGIASVVQVGVDKHRATTLTRECDSQVDGDGRSADAAFATGDRNQRRTGPVDRGSACSLADKLSQFVGLIVHC